MKIPKVTLYNPTDYLLPKMPRVKMNESVADRCEIKRPYCVSDLSPNFIKPGSLPNSYLDTIKQVTEYEDKVRGLLAEERLARRERGERILEMRKRSLDSSTHLVEYLKKGLAD